MSDSKLLAAAAPLTNLRANRRYLFGRYRGHPVSVTQQSVMEGNSLVFQVLLAAEAVQGVAAAIQDKEGLKATGLKPAMVRIVPAQRTLVYSYLPAVRSPKPEEIKAMLDGLTSVADRGGPPLGERCEQCGAPAPRIRLLNSSPAQLCDTDFQKLHMQYGAVSTATKAMKTNWAKAFGFGLIGVVVGSLVWAGILIASGYIFSLAAIAIAILIGLLVMKGAQKPNFGLIGFMAGFTLLAILAGTILWIAVEIVRLGGSFDPVLAFEGFLTVLRQDPGAVGSSIFFGLLGVFIGGSYMVRTTRAATPRFEVVE
jgi:hypothetical protein